MSIDKNVDKPVIIIFPCHLINTDILINQLMFQSSKKMKNLTCKIQIILIIDYVYCKK